MKILLCRGLSTPVYIALLPKLPSHETKCPSGEWIKKLWNICLIEYYTVVDKGEIVAFYTKWIDYKVIMLNEISKKYIIN